MTSKPRPPFSPQAQFVDPQTGLLTREGLRRLATPDAGNPVCELSTASATDERAVGEIWADDNFLYVRTASGTKKIGLIAL